jgi:hypothetical protein
MGTLYLVWKPDEGGTREDARRFDGFDHEDAAKRWAAWDDAHSADYTIVGGQPAEVCLAEDRPGSEPRRFVVHGEPCPHYWARGA